jgi:hypothetical protein
MKLFKWCCYSSPVKFVRLFSGKENLYSCGLANNLWLDKIGCGNGTEQIVEWLLNNLEKKMRILLSTVQDGQ